jgi:hypothetical protein
LEGLHVIVTPLVRKSASFAYTTIRTPFALVENRLPESSRVRTGLRVALETADSSVEQLLQLLTGESDARPSDATVDRVSSQVSSQDSDADREAIAEAVRERQPDVGELADPELDVADVQAELQAKHAIEAREEDTEWPDPDRGST